MSKFDWPDAAIQVLAEKWCDEGEAASVIGRMITVRFGELITKNGVIGKANRMGFKRGEPLPKGALKAITVLRARNPRTTDAQVRALLDDLRERGRAKRSRRARPPKARAAPIHVPQGPPIPIGTELADKVPDLLPMSKGDHRHFWEMPRNGCRYSVGHQNGFHVFCGKPSAPGSSFCQEHHARCWDAPKPVNRRERLKSRHALRVSE